MRRRIATASSVLAVTALLLSGCTGSSSGDGPGPGASTSAGNGSGQSGGSDGPDGSGDPGQSDEPAGPQCADVWKAGKKLPTDYTDCAAGSSTGPQDVTECSDDTRLIVFDDTLWAVTGDQVVEPDASPLQDTAEYGAAFGACTGE